MKRKLIILVFFLVGLKLSAHKASSLNIWNLPPLPVEKGSFSANWDSLKVYNTPDWFRDAKLGIWAHWGPQSVPEYGARYFMSIGQHHDNFDMWNSKYQPWNSVNMGPKRNIVKEWQTAAKNNKMRFGVSFHGEVAWQLFEVSRMSDTTGPKKGVPYDGWLTKDDGKGKWWEATIPGTFTITLINHPTLMCYVAPMSRKIYPIPRI